MKLNMLFIVMDLLIRLAYPIVFVHGKLGQIMNIRKKGKYAYSNDLFSKPADAERFPW